jgi:hypothetical protein
MKKVYWVAVALAAMLTAGMFGSASTAGEETRLRIINGLGRWDIHFVYISPASARSWGEDQLDDDQTLSSGESETWSVDGGEYDLRCKDEEEDTYTSYDVCIPTGMLVEWRVTLDNLDSD